MKLKEYELNVVNCLFILKICSNIKGQSVKTVTLTAVHTLKTGCYEVHDEKGLYENISRFWDLDAVGIADNEISF